MSDLSTIAPSMPSALPSSESSNSMNTTGPTVPTVQNSSPPSSPPQSPSQPSSPLSFLPQSLQSSPFTQYLLTNPYFTAGAGLVGVGFLAGLLKTSSTIGLEAAKKRCLISLEIPSKDPSYQWVMQWLLTREAMGSVNGNWHHMGVDTQYSKDNSGKVTCKFDFVPAPGKHLMYLGNQQQNGSTSKSFLDRFQFLQVERQRETKTIDLQTGQPWETLTLTTLSYPFGPQLFQRILQESQELALSKEEGKTVIYKVCGHEWIPFGKPKEIRPFDSVILDGQISQELSSDIFEFLNSKQWYLDRGIPYRRGYLMHGPPGCGKSSWVLALAGKLKYSICVLNLGDPSLTDDRLQHLLAVLPQNTIVLLEDIDQACNLGDGSLGGNSSLEGSNNSSSSGPGDADSQSKSESSNNNTNDSQSSTAPQQVQSNKIQTGLERNNQAYLGVTRVTFSGLLNALDGVTATEERLVFMTTNHLNRLPPVLIRPGRVDMRVYVGTASESQLKKMFERFYPKAPKSMKQEGNTISDSNSDNSQEQESDVTANTSNKSVSSESKTDNPDSESSDSDNLSNLSDRFVSEFRLIQNENKLDPYEDTLLGLDEMDLDDDEEEDDEEKIPLAPTSMAEVKTRSKIPLAPTSMAEVQGYLMFFKDRPEDCIGNVREWIYNNPHMKNQIQIYEKELEGKKKMKILEKLKKKREREVEREMKRNEEGGVVMKRYENTKESDGELDVGEVFQKPKPVTNLKTSAKA